MGLQIIEKIITNECLRDAFETGFKDASKEGCYTDKQWFSSGMHQEERPDEPVSHLNWTYIFLMTTKFIFEPSMFLS